MIPELPIAMLACARIGRNPQCCFRRFSAEALRDRILDCESELVITCDGYYRSGKTVQSKGNADKPSRIAQGKESHCCETDGMDIPFKQGEISGGTRKRGSRTFLLSANPRDGCGGCALYSLHQRSTANRRGLFTTTAGYLLYAALTLKYVFDVKDEDVWFCTADIGWVTGHSYILYGPLGIGATSLMFEGVPTYPQPDRFWEIVERFQSQRGFTRLPQRFEP